MPGPTQMTGVMPKEQPSAPDTVFTGREPMKADATGTDQSSAKERCYRDARRITALTASFRVASRRERALAPTA